MLHRETVEYHTLELLNALMADGELEHFYLVDGTALSLQIGHWKSIDFDFFTHQDFEAESLLKYLLDKGFSPNVIYCRKQTLIVEINKVKVDFIRFRYPFRHGVQIIEGVRFAHIEDVACMKIEAIVGRGQKKDFFDLYFLLRRYTLPQMMEWFVRMYEHSTLLHVYKNLTWFDDAETDADFEVFDQEASWETVKTAIFKSIESAI